MTALLNPTVYRETVAYENYESAATGLAQIFDKSKAKDKARVECTINGKHIHVTFNHNYPKDMAGLYVWSGSLFYQPARQAKKSYYQVKLTVEESKKDAADKLAPLLLNSLKAQQLISHDLIHIKTQNKQPSQSKPNIVVAPIVVETSRTKISNDKEAQKEKPPVDSHANEGPSLSLKSVSTFPTPGAYYHNGFWIVP